MAKSTKQNAGKETAASKKTPSGKKSGKSVPTAGAAPSIDTSLAAEAAAHMVANRGAINDAKVASAGAKTESSAFRQMKQNLAKPASQGLGDLLGNTGGQKKSNQPFGGPKQVGRNQTYGADVNRTGVPRRTSSG